MRAKQRPGRPVAILSLGLLLVAGCVSGPPPTPTMLGEIALEEGDWRTAKKHFAMALRVDPNSGRAWLGQARAQLMGRDSEAALHSFSSLSRIDPTRFRVEARPYYADGLEAATRGRLKREKTQSALVAVRALSKVDPNRRGLPALLGRALVAEAGRFKWAGQGDKALALYREACSVVPASLEAWVGAAEILLKMGKGQEAMQLLAAARKRHPTSGSIRTLTIQALSLR